MYLFKLSTQGIQVVENHPVLNDDVRLAQFVIGAAIVGIDRSGVDTRVYSEKSHADTVQIILGQGPEATVGVAIFGADTRVHDERSFPGSKKNILFQDALAACN